MTFYPISGRITKTRVGSNAASLEGEKIFRQEDAKAASEMTKKIPEIAIMEDTLSHALSISESPEWRDVYEKGKLGGADFLRNANIDTFKNFGTPEQQKMIGEFQADSGKVVQDAASQFKGSFRVGEQKLIDKMKAGTHDPVDVQIGKLRELKRALEFERQLSTLIPQLVRSKGMSLQEATDEALKLTGADQFKIHLEEKYGGNKKKQENENEFQWEKYRK